MIAIHKLCKAFGGKAVLQDFSCELEEGRVTALMAPSGAGKTTLLRILLGLETADSGEITGLSGKRLAAVFQEDRLLDIMTPVDNIRLPEPKLERAVILREMAAMGLTGCENQPVRELSGGMRRRVAILRALLCGADVIALDEPFKGLDEATKALVVAETKRLCAGKTVLLVTHEEKEAAMMGVEQVVRTETGCEKHVRLTPSVITLKKGRCPTSSVPFHMVL